MLESHVAAKLHTFRVDSVSERLDLGIEVLLDAVNAKSVSTRKTVLVFLC